MVSYVSALIPILPVNCRINLKEKRNTELCNCSTLCTAALLHNLSCGFFLDKLSFFLFCYPWLRPFMNKTLLQPGAYFIKYRNTTSLHYNRWLNSPSGLAIQRRTMRTFKWQLAVGLVLAAKYYYFCQRKRINIFFF